MKNKGLIITLISILSLIIIGLIVGLILLLNGSINFNHIVFNSKVVEELVYDEKYENKYENIKIESNAAQIIIKQSNDENIYAKVYGEKDRIKIDENTNTLKININTKKCNFLCFNYKIYKLELFIPANYDKQIEINNDYGDISITTFEFLNLTINEKSGDVDIETINNLNINNNYGDITISNVNKVDIDEDCGDIEIKSVKEANIENNYGDIKIGNIDGFFNIKEDCGDIEIKNINLTKNSKIKNSYGDIKIGNTNEIFIDAETDLGDKDINNNYRKSEITLEIDNSCGDIEVNN